MMLSTCLLKLFIHQILEHLNMCTAYFANELLQEYIGNEEL